MLSSTERQQLTTRLIELSTELLEPIADTYRAQLESEALQLEARMYQ